MTDNRPIEERVDEVVIGLADPAECDRIARLAETDAEVATLLERARLRYGELDETAEPVALPDNMWDRVAAALDNAVEDTEPVPSTTVVPFKRPASSPKLLWTSITSVAASLLMAAALGWMLMSRVEPAVIAVLINEAGDPVALVEGTEDNTTRITLLGPTTVPEGRIMQVWTKPNVDGPPVSLGILDRVESTQLDVEGLPTPSVNQLYEITFEQIGGSPTGLPVGPIHGKGLAQQPL